MSGRNTGEPIRVGAAADLPEGESLLVPAATAGTADDVAVVHAEDGEFYAVDDTCTHADSSLSEGLVDGTAIECSWHGAQFCLKTGEVLCRPATKALRTHRIEVRDGELWLTPTLD